MLNEIPYRGTQMPPTGFSFLKEAEMLPPRTTHSKQRRALDSACVEDGITLVEEVVSLSA
jgi:hypothetical protein